MAIALSYLSDLARVRVQLTGLEDGTVRVERSVNQLYWETVRGAVALPVSTGSAQIDDYEFVDGVPNFYRVVPVDPPGGLLLPGTSGNYASTPDNAALDITGDIDLRADVTLADWTTGTVRTLVAKYDTGTSNRSYNLRLSSGDMLQLVWSANGTSDNSALSTAAPAPDASGRLAVRATLDVNNGASGRTITFYTAPTLDGPWIQLGSTVVQGTVTSIFSGAAALTIGGRNGGTTEMLAGVVHAAEVRSGIGGTIVADPDFAAQATGTTSFADDAGRTWTVNGTAEILGPVLESDSITPDLDGQVWLKSLRYPFLNRPIDCVNHGDISRAARLGLFSVKGRSFPTAVTDLRQAQAFSLEIALTTLAEVRDMDLILATGQTMLVQLPAETVLDDEGCERVLALPGGYVEIGTTNQHRIFEGSQTNVWTLPCQVVAPPGPDVIGTTMTWGTVFSAYGNWLALVSANPTWADLLETVGSPDDLVVL